MELEMVESQNPIHQVARVAVVGAGAWGTALAKVLAEKGLSVRLWAYESEVVQSIRANRENTMYLPGIRLPELLTPIDDVGEAVNGADFVLFVVPSQVARSLMKQVLTSCSQPIPFVCATKGIEDGTGRLMSQVFDELAGSDWHQKFTVLSGPSFASEVSRSLPTAVTLMGENQSLVKHLQQAMMTSFFRIYSGGDLIGVQLGGALKNVMAIAAGVVDGLRLGQNARAALITRGLTEMIRLGSAMGADPRTFYGLSGVGDLVLTCTGSLSRNYSVGIRLGQGETLEHILQSMQAVAEGVKTSRAALALAQQHQIDMPIISEVCQVLFSGKSCHQAVSHLMERSAKEETTWSYGAMT